MPHHLQLARRQIGLTTEFELQQPTGQQNSPRQMASGVFVGFSNIDQHIGLLDGGFRLLN